MRLFMVVTEIDQKPGVEKVIDMVTTLGEVKAVISEEGVKVVEGDFLAMEDSRDVEDLKEIVINTTEVKEDSKIMGDKEGIMLEVKETGDMKEMEEINRENLSILLIKTENDSCVHLVVPLGICYRIVKIHGKTSTKVYF